MSGTSFYGVTDIWTYTLGALGIILLPGPNSLYVLSVATARGVHAGYMGALGIFVGDTVLLLLTALGAAGLLHTYPALFLVVKSAGAAYLVWVGFTLLRSCWRAWRQQGAKSPVVSAQSQSIAVAPAQMQPFRRALLISLLNPKAILFLLSFFLQFIDPTYDTPALTFLILSAIVMVFSAIYLSILITAGAYLAQSFALRPRLTASLAGSVGALFVWFGVKLATTNLH